MKPNKRYTEFNYTLKLSDDREKTILNVNTTFFVDFLQMKETMNVTYKKDAHDEKYSVPFLSTSLNACRMGKGMRPTVLQRVFLATLPQASNTPIYCPFPKNKLIIVTNLTLSDTFLPPMSIEKQFKVHVKSFMQIKDKKGWTFYNEHFWYGKYKK